MNGKLSSHDHGNCELCDFLESRLAQAQANEEALRKVVNAVTVFKNTDWKFQVSGGALDVWLPRWGMVLTALAALPEHLKE